MNRILVIDDSRDLRELLRTLLELENFEVRVAEDGASGLQAAIEWLPELILCDVNMPRMDGLTCLTRLRENNTTRGIPLLFITTGASSEEMKRGIESGAQAYITKPFETPALLAIIRSQLEHHSGH